MVEVPCRIDIEQTHTGGPTIKEGIQLDQVRSRAKIRLMGNDLALILNYIIFSLSMKP